MMNLRCCTKCNFNGDEKLFVKQKTKTGFRFVNRCKSCDVKRVQKQQKDNPNRHKEWENKSKENPNFKVRHREYTREYKKTNKNKVNARNRNRSKRVRQATPIWLTIEQRSQLITFYINRPIGYHVDHIIPIKGFNEQDEHVVCGLHVPWNLQYLLVDDNLTKSCKV